eukprot:scaffold7326_cov249-Pinguiococcus_pyrenoidosus.AAC.6
MVTAPDIGICDRATPEATRRARTAARARLRLRTKSAGRRLRSEKFKWHVCRALVPRLVPSRGLHSCPPSTPSRPAEQRARTHLASPGFRDRAVVPAGHWSAPYAARHGPVSEWLGAAGGTGVGVPGEGARARSEEL